IVTANAGRDPAGFAALGDFAERFAIPVVQHRPRYFSLPSSHPMNLGLESPRYVPQADVILVLECDVPWIASRPSPRPDCKVILLRARSAVHALPDPRLPVRRRGRGGRRRRFGRTERGARTNLQSGCGCAAKALDR